MMEEEVQAESKSGKRVVGRSVIGKNSSEKRVISNVMVPGVGKVTIVRRDAYTEASQKAGAKIKTMIGQSKLQRRGG